MHSLFLVESGILLAMAYGHFIAICSPPQIHLHTNTLVVKIGLGALMRGFASIVPPILPLYLYFPCCHSHVLSHAFAFIRMSLNWPVLIPPVLVPSPEHLPVTNQLEWKGQVSPPPFAINKTEGTEKIGLHIFWKNSLFHTRIMTSFYKV